MIEVWAATAGAWGRSGTEPDGRVLVRRREAAATAGEAPRLDVLVFARGLLRHQLTRIYFPDEAGANAADPVLSALAAGRPRDAGRRRRTATACASTSACRATRRRCSSRVTPFEAIFVPEAAARGRVGPRVARGDARRRARARERRVARGRRPGRRRGDGRRGLRRRPLRRAAARARRAAPPGTRSSRSCARCARRSATSTRSTSTAARRARTSSTRRRCSSRAGVLR